MKNQASVSTAGGVSQHLRFIQASLMLPADDQSPDKPGACLEIARLIDILVRQTEAGDAECGYFLAELTSFLWKSRDRLAGSNAKFHTVVEALKSGRGTTKRSSPLRPLIHQIIIEASTEKRVQELVSDIPHASLVIKRDKTLLEIADFRDDPDVVLSWTEKVIYPKLRAMESELEKDPVIGNLKKARDDDGNFHVSLLKPLIAQTVARIAALPKTYYFRIA